MVTEYHGDPVAGGTFPAQIWHTFMEEALAYLKEDAAVLPVHARPVRVAPARSSSATGSCRSTTATATTPKSGLFFSGQEPERTANCKPNEVEVPDVVGQTRAGGAARGSPAQPLTPRSSTRSRSRASGWTSCSADAREGAALGLRPGDARRREAAPRSRAAARRAAARPGASGSSSGAA